METLVPSLRSCLRQAWPVTLGTSIKSAKSNLHQILLFEIAKDQTQKSWFSHMEQEDQLSPALVNPLFNTKRVSCF